MNLYKLGFDPDRKAILVNEIAKRILEHSKIKNEDFAIEIARKWISKDAS